MSLLHTDWEFLVEDQPQTEDCLFKFCMETKCTRMRLFRSLKGALDVSWKLFNISRLILAIHSFKSLVLGVILLKGMKVTDPSSAVIYCDLHISI